MPNYNNLRLLPIVFPYYVHNMETAKEYVTNDYDPEPLMYINWNGTFAGKHSAFNVDNSNILNNVDMINLQVTSMTREFSVVAHAVAEIKGFKSYNEFGLAQIVSGMSQVSNFTYEDTGEYLELIVSNPEQERMNRRLVRLVDPILYIITYCLMSVRDLTVINIWQ